LGNAAEIKTREGKHTKVGEEKSLKGNSKKGVKKEKRRKRV